MKAFTDLEQSKKLAEILPIESADMFYYKDAVTKEDNPRVMDYSQVPKNKSMYYTPCWSFAALLGVLPYPEIWQYHSTNRWACSSLIKDTEYLWESENPVDSCVEVIIKLHKEGLL